MLERVRRATSAVGNAARVIGGEDEGRPAREAGGGQPAEGHPEEQDEHDAEPEVRQRLAEHGEDGARHVVPRAPPYRGADAEGDAGRDGDEHGRHRELNGGGQPLQHHAGGRAPGTGTTGRSLRGPRCAGTGRTGRTGLAQPEAADSARSPPTRGAPSGRSIRAGSPGRTRRMTKTRTDTPSSVSADCATRRRM